MEEGRELTIPTLELVSSLHDCPTKQEYVPILMHRDQLTFSRERLQNRTHIRVDSFEPLALLLILRQFDRDDSVPFDLTTRFKLFQIRSGLVTVHQSNVDFLSGSTSNR